MHPGKIVGAVTGRWNIIARYLRAAPDFSGIWPWLFVGIIRSRLFGGSGHAGRTSGYCRDFRLPIGRESGQSIIVDISSLRELDVLEEVIVGRIYPLERVKFGPAMILDCGSNIGYFAAMMRVAFPEADIVCWEPDSHNFSRLSAQPLLQGEKIRMFQAAVSDVDGEAPFHGDGSGGRLGAARGEARFVQTMNLPQWIRAHGRFPMVIKMDIEGHERSVLRAMKGFWNSPCILFLETHAERGDDSETLDDLASENFSVELLRTHRLNDDVRVFKEYCCVRDDRYMKTAPAARAATP